MAEAGAKICRLCGEDCSTRPRVKDPKGNYYCKACYERATERHASEVPEPDSTLDERPYALGDEEVRVPPAVGGGLRCQACGEPLAPGAVICVSCGFDLNAGRRMETAAVAPQITAASPRSTAWPIVVGVISIVLGVGGVFWLRRPSVRNEVATWS